MKIEEIKPHIRQFMFRQERGDPDFGSCMWASFILDTLNYTLHISSDCGEYAYGWSPTPKSESFVHLMSRIYEEYLLEKIAERDQFDYEASKRETITNLEYYYDDDPDRVNSIIEKIGIRELYDDMSDDFHAYYQAMDDILSDCGVDDTFEIIAGVFEYPAGAKKIAQIFHDVLQPILKAELTEKAVE